MAKYQLKYANTMEFDLPQEHVKSLVDAEERGDRHAQSRIIVEHATNQTLVKARWKVEKVTE